MIPNEKYWLPEILQPEPKLSGKTKGVERFIGIYTNQERTSRNMPELRVDEELATIAREHSIDMVDRSFFSHDNPSGEDPTERANRNRYASTKELGSGYFMTGIAENIGKMPTGNVEGIGYVADTPESIAKAHVDSWMESPGHRQNILDPRYDTLGVGVAFDGQFYVATQNFN